MNLTVVLSVEHEIFFQMQRINNTHGYIVINIKS